MAEVIRVFKSKNLRLRVSIRDNQFRMTLSRDGNKDHRLSYVDNLNPGVIDTILRFLAEAESESPDDPPIK